MYTLTDWLKRSLEAAAFALMLIGIFSIFEVLDIIMGPIP